MTADAARSTIGGHPAYAQGHQGSRVDAMGVMLLANCGQAINQLHGMHGWRVSPSRGLTHGHVTLGSSPRLS